MDFCLRNNSDQVLLSIPKVLFSKNVKQTSSILRVMVKGHLNKPVQVKKTKYNPEITLQAKSMDVSLSCDASNQHFLNDDPLTELNQQHFVSFYKFVEEDQPPFRF